LGVYYVWTAFFLPKAPPEENEPVQSGSVSEQPATAVPVSAPVAVVDEPCTDSRQALSGENFHLETSDCGAIRALQIPSQEAPLLATPWWTWLWAKVSGATSDPWQPYKPAGTHESLLTADGYFGVVGSGDPLLAPTGRWQVENKDNQIVSTQNLGNGLKVSRSLQATSEPDVFTVTVRWESATGAQGPFWIGLNDRMETMKNNYDTHTRVAAVVDGDLEQLSKPEDAQAGKIWDGPVSWIGLEDRYFLAALIPDADTWSDVHLQMTPDGITHAWIVSPQTALAAGESIDASFRLYLGPKEVERISAVGGNIDKAASLGFFGFFSKILLFFLGLWQNFVVNWGVAIIALTFSVRAALYPLAAKSFRSAKAMQVIQPELKALQEKYAEDKEALNREMMKLFAEHKVNPLGGCLPMFIQMPVFFALYSALMVTPALYHQSFLYLQDLSAPDPYGIFPTFMAAGMFVQQQLTPMTGMDPVQQRMMKLMPLMFAMFMFTVPSGLAVYYAVNTILSILQQWYNTRTYGPMRPAAVPTAGSAT